MTDAGDVGRGRDCYARRAWLACFEALSRADRAAPLDAGDLELLARAAYMLGRDDEYVDGLTRAHRVHRERGEIPAAARCAFWIGHNLLFRGEGPQAGGWFARARRLLEDGRHDCVEAGYLLIPVWLGQMRGGDWAGGAATAARAAAIGERFGDADLVWLARDDQGRALLKQGLREEGLRLVDEALVAATAGDLSPIVTGIVYCNTIEFCHDAFELRHARAWTEALTAWCEGQPEMVAHNGLCLVHRAEVMQQLQGAWADALEEARRAAARFTDGVLNQLACGKALYRQGEVLRRWGELASAEHAYREAGLHGCEPQPGLALLRLAQGRREAAAAGIRRAVGETTEPLRRAALLPAYVEIMLEVGDSEAARTAARQLEEVARRHGNDVVRAMCAHATGAVLVADGDGGGALAASRRAAQAWQEIGAPYDAARARVLVALACRLLGDEDAAELELEAARAAFEGLGARPDVGRVDSVSRRGGGAHGLSGRELEVLRLLSTGRSNREIAEALTISEHTVARHVQNIFAKLGVTSRTAAGAFAFERGLV